MIVTLLTLVMLEIPSHGVRNELTRTPFFVDLIGF